ncbi:MAG: hypothetical protein M3Z08_00400 [Chloroflexota bacterium]|nr:hypothetical protein [Chloroflexota bacterium]
MLVQSEMGAAGPSGSLLVVADGIRMLSPLAVIMVGTAFGFDDSKLKIGDILVSRQLFGYELQKVATNDKSQRMEFISRGDRPQASPRLLDHFRIGVLDWQGPKVAFGLLLSGDKLIDNLDYREQLRTFEPEALGGEMEGTGLYSAAQRSRVDWIIIKAICDWADGNKAQNKAARQQVAAENATRFTLHVLKQGRPITGILILSEVLPGRQMGQPLLPPRTIEQHAFGKQRPATISIPTTATLTG